MSSYKPKIEAKRWDRSWEKDLIADWESSGIYSFGGGDGPVYSIDTPPPYINSPIHIGHAYTYVWMDAIARYRRMKGYRVLFPLGLDRNGLPIEVQVEKEYRISPRSSSREEFLNKCRELLDKYEGVTVDYFRRLGISFNSWRRSHEPGGLYETDDPEFRRLTQETFIELYRKGLIYEGKKTVNYCPRCGTTISDAEVEYEDRDTDLAYLRFQLVGGGEVTIATTRPELLGACKAVIFNPEDDRYRGLEGRRAVVPIYGREVPILQHPYAKPDFGTGLVMICSYGDSADVQIFRELGLEPTYLIGEDGRMTRDAGPYAGLDVREARRRILEDLKERGLLVKVERIVHRTPVCWRCKTPIEFIASDEFFVRQVDFRDELLRVAESMEFHSPRSKELLMSWISSLSEDWPISRKRFYGTEIPLWYCRNCGERILPPTGRYYQPWREPPPVESCPRCGSRDFVGETRIFDTWFDSSNTVEYIMGFLWDREFFEHNFPASLRPQGKEIVRNWLYFTLLKSYLLYGKAPFRDVWIHMHVVDEEGRKMAKSLGNVVDPGEVMERYGAEALRSWAFLEGDITEGDIRCSYRRIEGHARYLTKLWNLSRFVSSFPVEAGCEPSTDTDRWIIAGLGALVERVNALNDGYDFHASMEAIRSFTWDVFADHYVEMVKERAYGRGFGEPEQKSAWCGLHTVLRNLLILQAPMLPFVTDAIWRQLYSNGSSIHTQRYVDHVDHDPSLNGYTPTIIEFNSRLWTEKKTRGMSFMDPIEAEIPEELSRFEPDLRALHRIITPARTP
ncbi:valine--tRNA ligase [Conexivisphaera calida]|uniref:Valine--tRNA ligase n=1 Tax=Conexivisphaera calida TaxID=1874277 RepID=A0A4P2VAQ1_9ARCH|nr:valine--tRNA ligase [Conexivisphaera calida]BBE41559.1 Valyl-tRNA synthetase [Conexivisphaera calida]